MCRIVILICAALLAGLAGRAVAQSPDTLKALLVYKCPLSPYLEAVYKRPANVDGRGRFLTISAKDRPQGFVQCMIGDGLVICEASAFYGGTVSRKIPLPAQAIAALQRLGFAIGTNGENLLYERAFSGEPDFDAVAILMLTTLHAAYGVREDTELQTSAPFAGALVTACRR